MANRPKGYGMTAELNEKTASKWDPELCGQVVNWMQEKLGVDGAELSSVVNTDPSSLHEILKNGVLLCKLINVMRPGSVKKVNTGKMAFKQMENIGLFLDGCVAMEIAKVDLFQTVDLYEAGNMPQVLNGIYSLGRKASELGPKESDPNKRVFTEEQLKAGQNVIGLQMGSNKGASQAGQNFGKTRSIID